MSELYYLNIGGTEVFNEQLISDLSSEDPEKSKKANALFAERIKETRVRVGTLLKTDNVSFLFGAGASIKAGGPGLASIPLQLEKALNDKARESGNNQDADWLALFYQTCSLLTGQTFDPEERALSLAGDLSEVPKIPINLEEYLSNLYMWAQAMPDSSSHTTFHFVAQTLDVPKDGIEQLIIEIKHSLITLVDLPTKNNEGVLFDHRRFIKKILTRPLNLRRANLFTLNYDTLIEQAADAEGAVLVDAFVGTLRRVFRPESYDLDFYFPAQTTEGRVHRFDRALHLYKLHGSITWHSCIGDWANPYGLYATFHNQAMPEDDVLIYPSPLKYGQTLGLPYSELFRRFGSAIAQPQSVLFTIGYGFGDEHVNALIRQALAIPSFTLIVIDPEPTSDFVNQLKQLGDERVWLVSGRELGTFEDFVAKLLPDLREEEITAKVMKTYNALAPAPAGDRPEPESGNDL